MFLLSHRNIDLCTVDGAETFSLLRDFVGEVPDRFCEGSYFEALVKDGKIALPATHRDRDVTDAGEAGAKALADNLKKTRKGKD